MKIEKVLDKEQHYTRGRDIEPITGMVVEKNYSLRYRKELANLAAKEYIMERFKKIYGHLGLKEDDEIDKILEIDSQTRTNIIKYTRQGLTLEMISQVDGMPKVDQIKEIIDSDPFFRQNYEEASKSSAIYLVDEKQNLVNDFIKGETKPHLDAFAVSVAGNLMSSIIKEKNPDKYSTNNKITINNNQENRVYKPSEIKMIVAHCLGTMDRKDLMETIKKAQDLLDELIAKDLTISSS